MSRDQSYEEFILGLYAALLKDCTAQYPGLAKEFDRDLLRLRSSLEHHGIRFFLDVMPAYRKHFDQCLDARRLTLTPLINFGSWRRRGGKVPRLFRGLFLRVFELTGELRSQPDVEAVRWIRQLLGAVRKLRLDSNTRDKCNTVDEFFEVDGDVENGDPNFWDTTLLPEEVQAFSDVSFVDLVKPQSSIEISDSVGSSTEASPSEGEDILTFTEQTAVATIVQQVADLIAATLGVFDPYQWKPRHGPGSVSDQRFGCNKYNFLHWPDRLDTVFPYADFAYANWGLWADNAMQKPSLQTLHDEVSATLCAVPKTISKPRLIASEPTALQWCQQIVRDYFYTRVNETVIGNFIDFRRQDLNGDLALVASRLQSHTTIDLSSASDRVSCRHVERLFRRSPALLCALRASRSRDVKQNISRTSPAMYHLRKYSTMGNATTFPVQSLFFACIAIACVLYVRKLPVKYATIQALSRDTVRVFGDDIIVPKDASRCTLGMLKAFAMKVNVHKTFGGYGFRESCGTDAFLGHDVTTVNILDVPRQASPGSVVSSVDVHHNLADAGMWGTANYIRKAVERCGYNTIRVVEHRSGFFGWSDLVSDHEPRCKTRWNDHLSRREIRCLALTVKNQRKPPEESSGLLQFFTEASNVVTSAISTLGHLVRRPKVSLSLRWVPVL